MIKRSLSLLIACMAVSLTPGCSERTRIQGPRVTLKADADIKHRLTLVISEDLGKVRSVTAYAVYAISNDVTCTPKDYSVAIGGRWNHYEQRFALPVSTESDVQFSTHALDSPLNNEDYYGLGVCYWNLSFVAFDVRFSRHSRSAIATGKQIESRDVLSLLCFSDPQRAAATCTEASKVPDETRTQFSPMTVHIDKE